MSFLSNANPRKRKPFLACIILLLISLSCSFTERIERNLNAMRSPIGVTIREPSDGAVFAKGETISFRADFVTFGSGETVSIEKIIWESSIDGVLQGESTDSSTKDRTFQTSELSPGTHEITFYARTTNKKSDSFTIKINVLGDDVSEDHDRRISIHTDRPESIEDFWAHRVAIRFKGDCPEVDAEHAWALPDPEVSDDNSNTQTEGMPCVWMWDVLNEIDGMTLDLGYSDDPENSWAEIDLTGVLIMTKFQDLAEENYGGYGTIDARGHIRDLVVIENSSGSILLEGWIPIHVVCQGDYLVLSTSCGYSVIEEGGIDITLDAFIKVDFGQRRLEIRYEEYPLGIPTGIGDGNTIESLNLDIALYWAE